MAASAVRPLRRLASSLDPSVNLVFASQRAPKGNVKAASQLADNTGGLIESRLVIRPRYAIIPSIDHSHIHSSLHITTH
jgi:hypothetical protein